MADLSNVISKKKQTNGKSGLYYLAMIFSTLFLVRYVTLWEPYLEIAVVFKYLAFLLTSFLFVVSISQYPSNKRLLVICLLFLSVIIGFNSDRLEFMYLTVALIVGAKNVNFDGIIKVHFFLSLFFCLFNIWGNHIGIIPDATSKDLSDRMEFITDEAVFRESFGYDWCTDFASHVFLIILSYWIYRKGLFNFVELVLVLAIAAFVVIKTGTRMSPGLMVLLVFFSIYYRFRNPLKIPKFVWIALLISTPFFAFLSLYATIQYNYSDVRWFAANVLFSSRLSLGQDAIDEKGIPWLGQEYIMYGMGNSNGGLEYNYIDNTYIQYFVICGIIATVSFILCYLNICYRAYKQKNLLIMLAVFLSGLFGVITQFHFNIAFCPLLLATCANLGTYQKKNKKIQRKLIDGKS